VDQVGSWQLPTLPPCFSVDRARWPRIARIVFDQKSGWLPSRGPSGPAGRAAESPEVPPLDQLIPLAELPKWVPPAPGGRRLHCHVPYRWASSGLRGVILRTISLPGTGKATTLEWYRQFVAELAAMPGREAHRRPKWPRPSRSGAPSPRVSERTARSLKKFGLAAEEGS
jgi:hypothetical protein